LFNWHWRPAYRLHTNMQGARFALRRVLDF
jgi:hypothetical protein